MDLMRHQAQHFSGALVSIEVRLKSCPCRILGQHKARSAEHIQNSSSVPEAALLPFPCTVS